MGVSHHVLGLVGALLCISTGSAQEWPTRPLTMVVPFAAGGPTDLIGRAVAPRMSEVLGQQIVIENVGGAGGMTGASRVARAAPDGYQFVLGGLGTFILNQLLYKKPPFDTKTDLTPVALVAEQAQILITRKDFPAGNLREVHCPREGEPHAALRIRRQRVRLACLLHPAQYRDGYQPCARALSRLGAADAGPAGRPTSTLVASRAHPRCRKSRPTP